MQTIRKKAVTLAGWIACVILCCHTGCAQQDREAPKSEPAEVAGPAINIDRTHNGAAIRLARRAPRDVPRMQRPLSFEMCGTAPEAAGDSTRDARAAATQAAIVNALFSAVVETRRAKGEPVVNFTANLGPRLTITHLSFEGGQEIRLSLSSARGDSEFVVRNGVLTHPPHDLETVRRVFDATNGEFSLIDTQRDELSGAITARVGCYGPASAETAIAADVDNGMSDGS